MNKENQYHTSNCKEQHFDIFFQSETDNCRIIPEHALIFVYAGELTVHCENREIKAHTGEYIYLHWDSNTTILKRPYQGEAFKSVIMGFNQNFLYEFHANMEKSMIIGRSDWLKSNILELPQNPCFQSLYISLQHYFSTGTMPDHNILKIKLIEAVYCLLHTDVRFYSILLNPVCSEYWIGETNESAFIKLQHERKATDIYMDVAYGDITFYMNTFRPNPKTYQP